MHLPVPPQAHISDSSPNTSSEDLKQMERVPNAPEVHREARPARWWTATYGFFGFNKGYNFPLFVILAGAMLGFSLARTSYLNVGGTFAKSASPGEWYAYSRGYYRVGITLHLVTCIPAGILMVFQFVPVIRHKAILFHRINGWIVTILVTLSMAGALMIARKAFGGAPPTQASIGLLVMLVITGLCMAIYNVKRLQNDQHRAWMLRTMVWLGSIITVRLVQVILGVVITTSSNYYATMTCGEVASISGLQRTLERYPVCAQPGTTRDTEVVVKASFATSGETTGVSLPFGFTTGMWLAIFLHTIGVEIYLNLTRAESERLRQVSYEKQLKAGMRNPGSAGLTADRWGDVEKWTPKSTV